jgi:transcriptional antiterminator Rof (Rho-off)
VTTTDYQPISCDLHSTYELLAMRRARVSLDADTPQQALRGVACRVVDVVTARGAEYLLVEIADRGPLEVRLDQLISVSPLD